MIDPSHLCTSCNKHEECIHCITHCSISKTLVWLNSNAVRISDYNLAAFLSVVWVWIWRCLDHDGLVTSRHWHRTPAPHPRYVTQASGTFHTHSLITDTWHGRCLRRILTNTTPSLSICCRSHLREALSEQKVWGHIIPCQQMWWTGNNRVLRTRGALS